MAVPRVSIALPPGVRACETGGDWLYARDGRGACTFMGDVEFLRSRFPSDESRHLYMGQVRDHMAAAAAGQVPWDLVAQISVAPDVLEIRLPDHWFSGGKMHVRLYFSEPRDLPGYLVALRLKTKRPGPIGVEDQDAVAREASDLLLEFQSAGYPA